jgi:hypothetical protein
LAESDIQPSSSSKSRRIGIKDLGATSPMLFQRRWLLSCAPNAQYPELRYLTA